MVHNYDRMIGRCMNNYCECMVPAGGMIFDRNQPSNHPISTKKTINYKPKSTSQSNRKVFLIGKKSIQTRQNEPFVCFI